MNKLINVFIGVAALGIAGSFFVNPFPEGQEVSIKGMETCITSTPITADCGIGFRTIDGKHYELENFRRGASNRQIINIHGTYSPGKSRYYNTEGIIFVESFEIF